MQVRWGICNCEWGIHNYGWGMCNNHGWGICNNCGWGIWNQRGGICDNCGWCNVSDVRVTCEWWKGSFECDTVVIKLLLYLFSDDSLVFFPLWLFFLFRGLPGPRFFVGSPDFSLFSLHTKQKVQHLHMLLLRQQHWYTCTFKKEVHTMFRNWCFLTKLPTVTVVTLLKWI